MLFLHGTYRGYSIDETVAPDDVTPVVAVSHRGVVVEWIEIGERTTAAAFSEAYKIIDAWHDAR